MKKLLLMSLLLVSGLVQAQTVSEAFKNGQVAKLVWNKDLIEAVQISQSRFVIIHIEKRDAKSDALMTRIGEIAKGYAGKYLIAVTYAEEANAVGSTVADKFNISASSNIDLILARSSELDQVGTAELTGDETVETLKASLDAFFAGRLPGQNGEEAPAQETTNSAPSKSIRDIKSLRNHNFAEVFHAKTDKEFEALLADSKNIAVIVDFSGEGWCGPCMRFHPTYDAVAKKFKGKVRFILANMQQGGSEPPSAGSYTKTGYVPELQVFKNGKSSGQVIELSNDVGEMAKIITRATGVKP